MIILNLLTFIVLLMFVLTLYLIYKIDDYSDNKDLGVVVVSTCALVCFALFLGVQIGMTKYYLGDAECVGTKDKEVICYSTKE
jgi:hypothetical protein